MNGNMLSAPWRSRHTEVSAGRCHGWCHRRGGDSLGHFSEWSRVRTASTSEDVSGRARQGRKVMTAQVGFRSSHWVLVVALVLAPTALLAQQDPAQRDDASESPSQKNLEQPEAAHAQMEEGLEQTDATRTETAADADPPAQDANAESDGPQVISGMSILGNQEAPTSLVIVPWKSSEIGDSVGVSTMLDDSRQPVDREVFMRALTYYEIRSEQAQ
jgi:hypothetical protein